LGSRHPWTTEKNAKIPFLQVAAQALHDENAHLRAQQAAREAQFERERATFEARLAEMAAAYAAANDKGLQLEQELAALKELLALREQTLFGRSTERRPLNDKTASTATKAKKPPKQRKGHGSTPQPDLPEVEVTHTVVGEKLKCDACGGQLKPVDTLAESTELIALERRKLVLERHLGTVYACSCGECLKTAPGPTKLVSGGRYDLSFTVHVGYQKYFAHVPTERQAKMFGHELRSWCSLMKLQPTRQCTGATQFHCEAHEQTAAHR
jgi:transposase